MNEYIINKMAIALNESGVLGEGKFEDAKKALYDYWKDKKADIWTVDDIVEHSVNQGSQITIDSARKVLEDMFQNLNTSDILDECIEKLGEEIPAGCVDVWDEKKKGR